MSVDKLLDREQIFLTSERPAFGGEEDLKTVGGNIIWSLKEREAVSDDGEPGFYSLRMIEDNATDLDMQCNRIIDDFLQFFSKVEQ
jgi:hypothetical protein